MADTNDRRYELLDERMRKVEATLGQHLVKCNESSDNATKSMDTLTGQVTILAESMQGVNDKVIEINAEKENAKGIAKGVKMACAVIIGLVTLVSIVFNIIHVIGEQ